MNNFKKDRNLPKFHVQFNAYIEDRNIKNRQNIIPDKRVIDNISFFQIVFSHYLEQVFKQKSDENDPQKAAETLTVFCRALIFDYKHGEKIEYAHMVTNRFLRYERSIRKAAGFGDDFNFLKEMGSDEIEGMINICAKIPFDEIFKANNVFIKSPPIKFELAKEYQIAAITGNYNINHLKNEPPTRKNLENILGL